ncbi:hypothetical protein CSUI_010215 [Cystoisospora suis]|uniref:Secreted protein n=1 Tax=Cystoisospora suis TaxID=483139 RepID=A0A2C6KHV6_9APIC|nr:hypothetical protein CSUI_010215 [Cystoisospora suis]
MKERRPTGKCLFCLFFLSSTSARCLLDFLSSLVLSFFLYYPIMSCHSHICQLRRGEKKKGAGEAKRRLFSLFSLKFLHNVYPYTQTARTRPLHTKTEREKKKESCLRRSFV